jgi:hypothetical protein
MFSMEVKQISPEFWIATLTLSEDGKEPMSRDFVVSEQQLAWLNALNAAAQF